MKENTNKIVNTLRKKIIIVPIILLIIIAIIIAVTKVRLRNNNNMRLQAQQEATLTQEVKSWYEVHSVNGDKIASTIIFESSLENIEYIKSPLSPIPTSEENEIRPEKEMKRISIDYELINEQTYEFKIKPENQVEETWKLVAEKDGNIEITMEQSDEYAKITKEGIVLQKKAKITNPIEGDFTNYYSLDKGKTWEEYTEEFYLQAKHKKILAKNNIATSGIKTIERVQSADVEMDLAEDALNVNCYDADQNTVQVVKEPKYIKISEEMQGHKIKVRWKGINKKSNIEFVTSDKTTVVRR